MADENKVESGNANVGTENVATSTPARQRYEEGKTYYIKHRGKTYRGHDPGDTKAGYEGGFLTVERGEVVKVSAAKARQLFRDFPRDWVDSNVKEFDVWERERAKARAEAQREADENLRKSQERELKHRQRVAMEQHTGEAEPEGGEED